MPQRPGTSAADVLLAIGRLMDDCHREALALQEAISLSLPMDAADLSRLETYQHLDHVTQVHADLGRLLPELSRALEDDARRVDHLAGTLRLISLRDRLFGTADARAAPPSGEVSFF